MLQKVELLPTFRNNFRNLRQPDLCKTGLIRGW